MPPNFGPGSSIRRGVKNAQKIKLKDSKKTIKRIFSYLKPHKTKLILIFFLILISTILSSLGPYFMGIALDKYIANFDLLGLKNIILLMIITYLGSFITNVIQGLLMSKISQKVLFSIRKHLFDHLETLSLNFFDKNPHGELMSRLTNDINTLNQLFSQNLTRIFSNIFSVIFILIMMINLSLPLTLVTILIIPCIMILIRLIGKKTRPGFQSLQVQTGKLNGLIEETISGQKTIKAYNQEKNNLTKFTKQNEEVRNAGIKAQSFALLVPPLTGIISNLNLALIAGIGGYLSLKDIITIGTIASFVSYTRRFSHPLMEISDIYNNIIQAIAGAERVFEIIDTKPTINNIGSPLTPQIKGNVEFKNISFSYDKKTPTLKNINLKAKAGQTIALVGPTGAGKTTIINLLTRFYDIDKGEILIDGINIKNFDKDYLRKNLGIVLQDGFLFSDTVENNIKYGKPDATQKEIIKAAQTAHIDHFVKELPRKYQTILTERGANLSQGQRQLITIARTILVNPDILILDEATSNVDTQTELLIQKTLHKLMEKKTSFVIAHRLSTIKNADQVLVIDNGQIIEQGTHKTLLTQKGFYYNLYTSQIK